MSVNYAEEPISNEPVKPKKKKLRLVISIILLLFGLGALGIAAYELVPQFMSEQEIAEIQDEAIIDGDKEAYDKSDINWKKLHKINDDIVAWLKVSKTSINYPVLQGKDNDYYLHHDAKNNWSMSGIFADYRCDVNGQNVIVYGHHMANGSMFAPVARAHHQDVFNKLGTLHWTTEEVGLTNYKPAFSLNVYKTYEPVQKFKFDPNAKALDKAAVEVALKNNLVEAESMTYEVLPASLVDEAYAQAKTATFQNWVKELYKDADAKASDVKDLINNSDRAVILCTCSSGLAGMPWRTYTVFLHTV